MRFRGYPARVLAVCPISRSCMQTPKRLDYAHQLAPERYIGSPVIRWSSWLILGRNRDGVGRAVFVLCLLSLFIFPAFYMAAHKYETGDRSYSVAIEDISRRCIDGSGQIGPAAIYASVRNALFLIPVSDELSAKVDGCLYGKKSKKVGGQLVCARPANAGSS